MWHVHMVSIAICRIAPYGAVAILAVAVGLGLFDSLITLIKTKEDKPCAKRRGRPLRTT